MKQILDKKLLIPYKDFLLKRISFLYGLDYIETLRERLDSINSLVLTDEIGLSTMNYNYKEKSLRINSRVFNDKSNFNSSFEFDKCSDFFKHSLLHELLHVASIRDNIVGIYKSDNNFINPLNEGVTQLITDDIVGYYENKFIGSYNIEKLIAGVIRSCLGNKTFLDSYFINPELLESKIDSLSCDLKYYNYLNRMINNYIHVKDSTKKPRLDLILKSLVLNVILPTYKNNNNKEKFLSNLIYNLSGDEVIKNKIIGFINEYINISNEDRYNTDMEIFYSFKKLENESDILKELPDIKKIFVKNNGSIIALKDNSEITSHIECEKIYTKLFKLMDLTIENINQYIESIKLGKPIMINHNSILDRRIFFCGIKECLSNNGYIVLNDYEELNNSNSITLKAISKKIEYEDFKTICECYSLCKTRVGKNEYDYSIVYRSTKNEVEDEVLKNISFYALNWLNSIQNNGFNGINNAFSKKNKESFVSLFALFCDICRNKDKFEISEIEKRFKDKKLVRKLLETPIQFEWVYGFMVNAVSNGPINQMKGLSYNETKFNNYLLKRSNEEAKEIIRKNR